MALAAVMCANMFNGLNTAAWTGWVFFAVSIGVVLVWAYTVCYYLLPGLFNCLIIFAGHLLPHLPRMVLCTCLVRILKRSLCT